MDLVAGRISLTTAESEAIDQLLEGFDGHAGFSRRDPGEQGPVLLTVGEKLYEVYENGEWKRL